jgi:hypothetical protein
MLAITFMIVNHETLSRLQVVQYTTFSLLKVPLLPLPIAMPSVKIVSTPLTLDGSRLIPNGGSVECNCGGFQTSDQSNFLQGF